MKKYLTVYLIIAIAGCASSPSNTSNSQQKNSPVFQRPSESLDYGVIYYAIGDINKKSIPEGNYQGTIPQFEASITEQGLLLHRTSLHVLSYDNSEEQFLINYSSGHVVRSLNDRKKHIDQLIRTTRTSNFMQWHPSDTDVVSFNSILASNNHVPLKQGDSIPIHFILRSSSSQQPQVHHISIIESLSFILD